MDKDVPALLRAVIVVVAVLVVAAVVGWIALANGWYGGQAGSVSQGLPGQDPGSPMPPSTVRSTAPAPATGRVSASPSRHAGHARRAPLTGKVVVIDPGHQLGNHDHLAEIDRLVDAGGIRKPCNTTGTATSSGYPEATFNWDVAQDLRALLRRQGALVRLTRHSNSDSAWGPCVDARGRFGNPGQPGPTADVKLSIHADGSLSTGAHGFDVIAPGAIPGYTTGIAGPSLDLARTVRNRMVASGFATSTYTGVRGIDVRRDLGTLNLSKRPVAMIECGNMRDPGDAALLTSSRGQRRIARALADALERYLTR